MRQSAELVLRLIVPPFLLGGIKGLTTRAQRALRQERR
jgi:hypothetical protein